jgi:transposase
MSWLGRPLESSCDDLDAPVSLEAEGGPGDGDGAARGGGKAPALAKSVRRIKDLLEERIFSQRANLLTNLELVFFDTTSLYFHGQGGEELGRRGFSKDHRSELNQVVFGVVIDSDGFPICTEIWPGNTADVTTLVPVAERLKKRFDIRRVCIVADRGMISKNTIERLAEMGWSYIFGERMRVAAEIREVLADKGPLLEVRGERQKSTDPAPLQVKQVFVNGKRYIVCLNEEEARKDKYDRDSTIAGLEKALTKGDKSLVGNKGYKLYLKKGSSNFEIDYDKVQKDAIYDGKFILRTDMHSNTAEIALQYKQLLTIELLFKISKSNLDTRPIYHQADINIVGHIEVSFLALLLKAYLMKALKKDIKDKENTVEWQDIVHGLMNLDYSIIDNKSKKYAIRSEMKKGAVRAFRALGIKYPDIINML